MGYGQDEFGYRLYDLIEKKIIRSRDAVFIENQTIEDMNKIEKSVLNSFDDLVELDPVPFDTGTNAHTN